MTDSLTATELQPSRARHFLPRPMMVREALAWLDQYLGPVRRQ